MLVIKKMISNKSKKECITWLSLHGLTASGTLQELKMRISKVQHYPSLTKKSKVEYENKLFLAPV